MPRPAAKHPDHGGLTAVEARALRDEVRALRIGSIMQADLTELAVETIHRQALRIAELESEVSAWEQRYRDMVEAQRDLLRAQSTSRP